MRLFTREMPDDFNIFAFGDRHRGNLLFYAPGWEALIDMMHKPYRGVAASKNFGIDHGDTVEAICVDDRRFDLDTIDKDMVPPLVQADTVAAELKPIAKKILCILQGNHEYTLSKFGDLTDYICKQTGIPYGTNTAKLSFVAKDGTLIYKHFCTHGRKSISSTADDPRRRRVNMELILKRHLKHKAGDCLVMSKGHTHKLLVCKPESDLYLTDDGKQIKQVYTTSEQTDGYIHPDHRYFVNTGSFLKLYGDDVSGYAERAEYDPVELGFCIVIVRDRKVVDVERVVV
jgi:hypothetical protein